jgi:tagatose-1,6-bisphosphate aldolase non-catalytic subunit AgaZ/GatZ
MRRHAEEVLVTGISRLAPPESPHPPHIPARLGVGPMSRNAVDAALAVAHRRREPLMLIPSRRQVEAAGQGGGYVEGWTTQTFARYVRDRDPDRLLLLCRDHGGPYQNPQERRLRHTAADAMACAAQSFREDIRQGFDLLHIDTSADLDGTADVATAIDRAAGLPAPTFVVAQTATKVAETRNTGALTLAPYAVESAVRELAGETCRDIKEAARPRAEARGIDLDGRLRDAVAASIGHYTAALPLRELTAERQLTAAP